MTYVVVKAMFVVVAFAPQNMQIAIMRLAQLLLLIDRFCTISPSGDGSKNILQEKGEQIWQQSERGDAADFLKPSVCKGGIEHLCLATTPGKAKDDDGAVCNLVALLFVWSLQGVMDLFVPPALELTLEKSKALCHGRCVQWVMESSRACA